MAFDSMPFLLFVTLFFAAYWLCGCRVALQNLVLLVASLVFYGWTDGRMLPLLLGVTSVAYLYGLVRPRLAAFPRLDKAALIVVCLMLFGVLCYFKYADFFVAQFAAVFGCAPVGALRIILPVGISFYVFMATGYVFDVWRGKVEPERNALTFFAFSTFFPQLLAGPIGRADSLLPQYRGARCFDYANAIMGSRMVLWGLFKKVVIADNCAVAADALLANGSNGLAVWCGMFFFALQIYFDFSGYSETAVGVGRWFGIRLMRNFAYPYFAKNIAEFWRRWHISLTTWFRDYLYFPLGGSRCSKVKQVRNTFVVFLVSGFWHGANWTYVLWGAFHAVAFLPLLLRGTNHRQKTADSASFAWGIPLTFLLALVGWTFFRAPDVGMAFTRLGSMFNPLCFSALSKAPDEWKVALVGSLVGFALEWVNRREESAFARLPPWRVVRWTIYYLTAVLVLCYQPASQAFVYFKF